LPSLRRRLVAALDARPGDVLTPPQLTRIVGARPDGVRNALLELAARGKVEKVGEGQYRARARQEISASEAEAAEPMRGAA
jgi:DNA-binding GntR family transcriptional regulator